MNIKVTRSQLTQIIKEELDELFGKEKERYLTTGPRGSALGRHSGDMQAETKHILGYGSNKAGTIALFYHPEGVGAAEYDKPHYDERIYYDQDKDKWVDGAGRSLEGFNRDIQVQAEKVFQEVRKQLETQAKDEGFEIMDPTWGLVYKKGI